jgi:hypothetical protein
MSTSFPKKNKVDLAEYDYRKDIENRLLMATFTSLEVDVLREILNNSLQFTIRQLQDSLEVETFSIIEALNKITRTKLIRMNGSVVFVDKEMRKYYELQILKFDDGFELGMEFLQGLLSKVPIHVLPLWYNITRLNDNIFCSIVEKYLLTPKIYERHLIEAALENEMFARIYQDVCNSPALEVSAKEIMEKYSLSHERFEEYMLLLEYNFICCLSYRRKGESWEEVVTPFVEWKEYLLFLTHNTSKTIQDASTIVRAHPDDFGFAQDMTAVLQALPLPIERKENEKDFTLSNPTGISVLPRFQSLPAPETHFKNVICQIISLNLADVKGSNLCIKSEGKQWLKMSLQDQALLLYRHSVQSVSTAEMTDKDMREVERGLKKIARSGWIYLDDFIRGFTAPIGTLEHVTLRNRGKKWKYMLPFYADHERKIIEKTLEGRLFQAGMIAMGIHMDKKCFMVTPFGRMSLGD